jgi:hypothetical protein
LKSQVDEAKLSGANDILIPDLEQMMNPMPEAKKDDSDEETSLVNKIKSKDQLIKEIDAQISRLDALDEPVGQKQKG